MLGALTGSDRYATMFIVGDLKIFFATRHMSLREALDHLTRQSLTRAIEESWTALEVLGHDPPRLAVAALNPHGGEGGNFGEEEIKIIGPACEQARRSGRAVDGPIPADSVFHQGLQGRYDGILAQFHDQGHIAAKTVDFDGTVSVTMGLPILRTSVDHGTAFDIAGTGKASHAAMAAAYRVAAELAAYTDRIRAEYGTER
jgi:4-hydroxy-L-threonine phosphate dehydrogenase PdxA